MWLGFRVRVRVTFVVDSLGHWDRMRHGYGVRCFDPDEEDLRPEDTYTHAISYTQHIHTHTRSHSLSLSLSLPLSLSLSHTHTHTRTTKVKGMVDSLGHWDRIRHGYGVRCFDPNGASLRPKNQMILCIRFVGEDSLHCVCW